MFVCLFVSGLRLLQNNLYVADANFGIYSVNLNTNDVTSLVAPNAISPKIGLADDLCISKDQKFIYFTDGSSKYSLAEMAYYLLEGISKCVLSNNKIRFVNCCRVTILDE